MAIIGRAIRHAAVDRASETPARATERVAFRQIGERANREMMERFAPLTAENVEAAMRWQEDRIKALVADTQAGRS